MSKCLRASAVRGVGAPSRSMMVPMGCASAQKLFHLLQALSMACFFSQVQDQGNAFFAGALEDELACKGLDVAEEGNEMG